MHSIKIRAVCFNQIKRLSEELIKTDRTAFNRMHALLYEIEKIKINFVEK